MDTAMFHVWTYNPKIDLSFLENEAKATVARWKARLEDELLTLTDMAAGQDLDDEASSRTEKPNGEPPVEKTPS